MCVLIDHGDDFVRLTDKISNFYGGQKEYKIWKLDGSVSSRSSQLLDSVIFIFVLNGLSRLNVENKCPVMKIDN